MFTQSKKGVFHSRMSHNVYLYALPAILFGQAILCKTGRCIIVCHFKMGDVMVFFVSDKVKLM